ncbi:MAG: hypothetical protein KatS3mg111_3972 [Pirellulaceae bacterium]|nr:MAG: hypothetical protein KatS3mg111_3972 [Pirellulaceae bacterium]
MEAFMALVALTAMEIVLGIDNIVFISVASGRLVAHQRSAARRYGLLFALGTRVALLASIYWVMQLNNPLLELNRWLPLDQFRSRFYLELPADVVSHRAENGNTNHRVAEATVEDGSTVAHESVDGLSDEKGIGSSAPAHDRAEETVRVFDHHAWIEFTTVTWRDLVLLAGGLFLIFSSVREIHEEVELPGHHGHSVETLVGTEATTVGEEQPSRATMWSVVAQIAVMDIIFSLDSVITAVGMADQLWVMVVAIVLAILIMIRFADQVGEFVQRHPTVKMLALSFLLLIGVMLCAEGIGTPINKGYIYFAMAFSLAVEAINMRVRRKYALATHGT